MSETLIPGASHDDLSTGPDAMRWTPDTDHQAEDCSTLADLFGGPIHRYTRAQALADGALVAVPDGVAREAGFSVPIALTAAAWADCVAWTDEDNARQTYQDESGRLWDVLWMTRWAIGRNLGGNRVTVELARVPRDGRSSRAATVHLAVEIGPDDHGAPVLKIMQPDED
ncbi:DUF6573 family protein [Streptomyces sp. NPDC050485]|uniref:DUF6573 family protein n=1 Tax=Streptomyces sp. NPDC050485 TaxID=3365617 RepID=UPI00379179F6